MRKKSSILFWVALLVGWGGAYLLSRYAWEVGKWALLVMLWLFTDYFLKADLRSDEK